MVQKCVGCEVIADKQAELAADGEAPHGMKVGLIPVAAKAALDLINDLKKHSSEDD